MLQRFAVALAALDLASNSPDAFGCLNQLLAMVLGLLFGCVIDMNNRRVSKD